MFQLFSWRTIIGMVLILSSWIDPFNFGMEFAVVAFILGFDLMPLISKIVIFGIDFWLNISGFGGFLLIQITENIIFHFFALGRIVELIVKPAIVFFLIYISNLPVWLALLVAVIDFFLNYQKKLL
ncbi:MAG: hypothetical protein J4428_00165 [Candidatus Aenigmarchaeota archaeon]|nr:hypothetical protein [Candidatus Aenigmarchaeota archaeon]